MRTRNSSSALAYRFGVSGCLSDYFEAPHIVKHVIHAECAISGVFVGTEFVLPLIQFHFHPCCL